MITIEFSGWLEVEPAAVRFQGTQKEGIITGVEWLALPKAEQGQYILESLSDAMEVSHELEYTDLSVFPSCEEYS